jgi:hypothetical protein
MLRTDKLVMQRICPVEQIINITLFLYEKQITEIKRMIYALKISLQDIDIDLVRLVWRILYLCISRNVTSGIS